MTEMADKPCSKEKEFYGPYASFGRILRAWLVAYGIGALVLFASQDAFKRIQEGPEIAKSIIGFFLFGVAVQVVAALVYKYSMGYIYFGELNEKFQRTRRYKVSDWISEAMWLEMLFDILTIASFGWATYRVLSLFLKH